METIQGKREVMARVEITPFICFEDTRMLGAALQKAADEICLKFETVLSDSYSQDIKIRTVTARWESKENEPHIGRFYLSVRGNRDTFPDPSSDSDLNEPLPARTCSEGECCESCQ